jgi:tetratricopeptide (TPR) repeat protein
MVACWEQCQPARKADPDDLARPDLALHIRAVFAAGQLTRVTGPAGLGQAQSAVLGLGDVPGWSVLSADGCWRTGGYLSGFHELITQAFAWAEGAEGAELDLVARHEQTLKRIWPTRPSTAYRVPKDLTNSSDREERTRFYHHEYQNKLLFGLSEFLLDVLLAADRSVALVIDDAGALAPSSRSLIDIFARQTRSAERLRFILLDEGGAVAAPGMSTVSPLPYPRADFERHLGLDGIPRAQRELIYTSSEGNLRVGRALAHCVEHGVGLAGHLNGTAIIDLYLAGLGSDERARLARGYIRSGLVGDAIARRNAETFDTAFMDAENGRQHAIAMETYRRGDGPLVLAHALAVASRSQRIEALVEPCEILMGIGLYDTWFSFFAAMFNDPALRAYGDGDEPVNGLFINAAFVLYAMGNAHAAAPLLDEFIERWPASRFIPTALYAQSMIHGRYQIPIDLDRAEACATRNLALIEERFRDHPKYKYIKVFAENAFAYIKARQGKFVEALDLCGRGVAEILAAYGETRFRLHRSILIYNTSQVFELVHDLDRAEAHLRDAIACDPYYAEYWNDLGNLLSRGAGREQEALAAYDRAITLSPPYHEAHLNRGILRVQVGDRAGALADFRRTLEIKPEEWRAFREIGTFKLLEGDVEGAGDAYARALAYEERDADLQANAGLACSELNDPDGALRHYRRAISLNPAHAAAHNNLAADFARRGFYDEALHHADLASRYGDEPDFMTNREVLAALCEARA